jgi:hypothetical protein
VAGGQDLRGRRGVGDGGLRADLAQLVHGEWAADVQLGRAEHVTVPVAGQESITCVESGLWLVGDRDEAVVIMLNSTASFGRGDRLRLEMMARERGRAEDVLAELRRLMSEHKSDEPAARQRLAQRHGHAAARVLADRRDPKRLVARSTRLRGERPWGHALTRRAAR